MQVHLFGNVEGFHYQRPQINLFDLAKEQNNQPVKFKDTEAGKNLPVIKLNISEEGLRALHGSKLHGSVDLEAEQKQMEFYAEHQPIESFRNRLSREVQDEIAKLKEEDPDKNITIEDKKNIIMNSFQTMAKEVVTGHDDGTRIRYIADSDSEDGYRKLSKEDELSILQQEFDDYVESRFGLQHQKESEMVAKAVNRLQDIKLEMGRGDIRYYEPEKIPEGFAEEMQNSAKSYVASLSESGKKVSEDSKKSESTTMNTDRVDREIRELKEKKARLEQEMNMANEQKKKEIAVELRQVEMELVQKNNDTYRRQHAVIS